MSTTGWVVLGVIVVLVLWIIVIYNQLVAMRQRVSQSFADVDVQLKLRHDLIPNLVETVRGFAAQERTVPVSVTLLPSTSTLMFLASSSAVRTNASSIFFFKSDGARRGLTTIKFVTPLTPDSRRTTSYASSR